MHKVVERAAEKNKVGERRHCWACLKDLEVSRCNLERPSMKDMDKTLKNRGVGSWKDVEWDIKEQITSRRKQKRKLERMIPFKMSGMAGRHLSSGLSEWAS